MSDRWEVVCADGKVLVWHLTERGAREIAATFDERNVRGCGPHTVRQASAEPAGAPGGES